ncbi:MAG: hypothetical protein OEY86_15315, partial [Nitrospira sp.]|nr:hypothetical protein [Nitrospira sp.]
MVDTTRFCCALLFFGGDGGHDGAALARALRDDVAAVALAPDMVATLAASCASTATPTDRRKQTWRTPTADSTQTTLGASRSSAFESAHATGRLPDHCTSFQPTLGCTPANDREQDLRGGH